MCEDLRKVVFSLGNYEFDPDASEAEQNEMQELCKERKGYFHKLTEDVDNSKDVPFVKTMALVEDVESGNLHEVQTYNLRFVKEWP